MNWKLIFLLSIPGLILSVVYVYWASPWGDMLWVPLMYSTYAYLIARNAPGKYFLHGFVLGMLNYMWMAGSHVLFYSRFSARLSNINRGLVLIKIQSHPRLMLVEGDLMHGLVAGLAIGIYALLCSRYVIKIHNYPKYKKEMALLKQQEAQSQ